MAIPKGIPNQATRGLDRSLGIGSNSSLPVSLVIKHSTKVTDNVKDTKNQTTFGPHGQVRALSVTRDRVGPGGIVEQFPHLGWRADNGRGSIGDESE